MHLGIKAWPVQERPREKLFREGEARLSDVELIALLLGTGTRGKNAVDLARGLLAQFKTLRVMGQADISQWRAIAGIGTGKIARIKAAFEIGRRVSEEAVRNEGFKITSAHDAARLLMPRLRDLKKEVFKTILVNSQNKIIEIVEITEGTVNHAHPEIREIFLKALHFFAAALICVHNHPSGDPTPSSEDLIFSQEVDQAGKVLGITVLDHIIIGDTTYFSFAEQGVSGKMPKTGR